MDYVLVFSAGIILGFVGAWFSLRSANQTNSELSKQYGTLSEQLRSLSETTDKLKRVLGDRTYRGKWGERRALEILELAGFEKDKHFRSQKASQNDDGKRIIPDFTFEFPNDILLYMDAKFPLDQYEKYLDSTNQVAREGHRDQFLKNVRRHVKTLSQKGYINSNTVSFVVLFIPFESLFRFIHEQDTALIDDALEQRVVMCSPLTLYVLLSTIRQSIDSFAYNKAASEIRSAFEQVNKERDKYEGKLDDIGDKLDKVQSAYDELKGTRARQLRNAIDKIESTVDKYRTLPPE